MENIDEVEFINGRTRMYAIIGDPIEQVRSPEMVTWEMQQRGLNAVLFPLHLADPDFEATLPALFRIQNLDGLIFTIPFKARAMPFADVVGPNARLLEAFNAMVRRPDGRWSAEMFDGLGCVEAFRRRGQAISGKRLMLIGLGGAGSAIGAAMAAERPQSMTIFDMSPERCERMRQMISGISPNTQVEISPPTTDDIDILLNATPVGMLGDSRLPIAVEHLPESLVVFDAIVKPEATPLLQLAQRCGCTVIRGREMMRGQISRIVDFFEVQTAARLS